MDYSNTTELTNKYLSDYAKAISDGEVKLQRPVTYQSYIDFKNNPDRKSNNITEEEYQKIMETIAEGENSTNKEVQEFAKQLRTKMETLRETSFEIEYGVSEEEFNSGNRGTYDEQLQKINEREEKLLEELRQLDNASFKDKFLDLFTGKLTEKRKIIGIELNAITYSRDRLNSKISYDAILTEKLDNTEK